MGVIVDEFFERFLSDLGSLITGTFHSVEFLLGIIYFCGQQLSSWILEGGLAIWSCLQQCVEILLAIGSELFDFGGAIVRGVLLFYYGIWMVFEAFYLTASDLKKLTVHIFTTVGEVLNDSQNGVVFYSTELIRRVPRHICNALVVVGEMAIDSFATTGKILVDFTCQLVLAPINVIKSSYNLLWTITYLPVELFKQIPIEGHVGLAVVFVVCSMYWKLGFCSVVRPFLVLVDHGFSAFAKIFMIIRNTKRIVRAVITSEDITEMKESYRESSTKAICVVCQDKTVSYISMPCRHVCLCLDCVKTLVDFDNRCPLCRIVVIQFEKVYIPL